MRIFGALLGFLLTAALADGDVLVFRDGDRVQGRLVRQEAGMIVFQSHRFGEIHVAFAEATVEADAPPLAAEASPKPDTAAAIPVAAPERTWHGRLAVDLQWVSDDKDKRDTSLLARTERKWTDDEVRLEVHYDVKRADGKSTEDFIRATAYWRHDLPHRYFVLYTPVVEWDRAFTGLAPFAPVAKYLLTQQQAGFGYSLLDDDPFILRVGVAENWLGLWLYEPADVDVHAWFESAFVEAEFQLPWSVQLREFGQLYAYRGDAGLGWDNTIEFSKKLTDALSLSLRHEYRSNRPSLKGSDYSKLKLLLGFDY